MPMPIASGLTDGPRADAVEASLRQALGSGRVVVCDAALAGVCASLRNGAEALAALEEMGVHYNAVESKSALRAGEMQRRQRQRSGEARVDGPWERNRRRPRRVAKSGVGRGQDVPKHAGVVGADGDDVRQGPPVARVGREDTDGRQRGPGAGGEVDIEHKG